MPATTAHPATTASVGIIGAGITGLTAAFQLRRAGIATTVYEAAARPGGVICSFREGPWLAEGGPNTILDTSPVIGQLIGELGLVGRRLDSRPEATARYVVRDGRPVPLPSSGPKFFVSPLFSWKAKSRLLAEPFIPRAESEESVADFVRRRLGQEFLDYAIDPLVTGIYAGDPAALSIQHAFPRVYAQEDQYGSLIRGQIFGARERKRRGEVSKANAKKFSFDQGLQVLPDALAQALGQDLHLNCRIDGIQPTQSGWCLNGRHGDQPLTAEHRVVLFCGTAHTLARLQIDVPGAPSLQPLGSVNYPPVSSVVLGFRRGDVDHPCEGFGMLIPHREGFGILGTIFSSSLFTGRAPEDHLTLTVYVGGVRNADKAALPDTELIDLVRRDLNRLLGVRGAPVYSHITRWPAAIPQYDVGYGNHKALLDQLESKAPGLFIAGHYRDGVALSDSLGTGTRTAERIVGYLNPKIPTKPQAAP
ncbi:MAG: protoporphyrinogen oxidase [Verrucomicrobiales bacterium]|nr:protoporphyrinogen oxidase [Verrucomicrobiales bacterium]